MGSRAFASRSLVLRPPSIARPCFGSQGTCFTREAISSPRCVRKVQLQRLTRHGPSRNVASPHAPLCSHKGMAHGLGVAPRCSRDTRPHTHHGTTEKPLPHTQAGDRATAGASELVCRLEAASLQSLATPPGGPLPMLAPWRWATPQPPSPGPLVSTPKGRSGAAAGGPKKGSASKEWPPQQQRMPPPV